MSYFANNFTLTEATTGGFTIAATATTVYSLEYDVSKFSAPSTLFIKYVYTSKSGAVITPTLEMYSYALGAWFSHPVSITASDPAGAATQTARYELTNDYGTRIRIKLVSSGTFGASESVVTTVGFVAKGGV